MSLITDWTKIVKNSYVYYFTSTDEKNQMQYFHYLDSGIKQVKNFAGKNYNHSFDVFIHPDRKSLEKQWSADWGIKDFKSECWMVASGTGNKLDILSPATWDSLSCEHKSSEKEEVQKLITHELFHVYHGQNNPSQDFSVADTIDWFVEGFAVYASGQCDSTRIRSVKNAIWFNQSPEALKDFWTGKLKYGFSGSMVMYIDKQYGRKKILSLLNKTSASTILKELNLSEVELIAKWKEYYSQ